MIYNIPWLTEGGKLPTGRLPFPKTVQQPISSPPAALQPSYLSSGLHLDPEMCRRCPRSWGCGHEDGWSLPVRRAGNGEVRTASAELWSDRGPGQHKDRREPPSRPGAVPEDRASEPGPQGEGGIRWAGALSITLAREIQNRTARSLDRRVRRAGES